MAIPDGQGMIGFSDMRKSVTDYLNQEHGYIENINNLNPIDKIYYIEENYNGKEELGTEQCPFKSIDKVVEILPLFINYNITINLMSEITKEININNLNLLHGKQFIINCYNFKIEKLNINNCHGSHIDYAIQIKNGRFNKNIDIINSDNVKLDNCSIYGTGEIGLYANSSVIWLNEFDFGNELLTKGVRADLNSIVYCYNNKGLCKEYGIVSKRNSTVKQDGASLVKGKFANEVYLALT